MTIIKTRLRLDQAAILKLLVGPTGPVMRFLREVTRDVRTLAVLYCPVDTGNLRNSIYERVQVGRGKILAYVGTDVPYAEFVHEGTRPHIIRARPGGVLRFTVGSEVVFTPYVNHPGTRGQPFLRRAVVEGATKHGFRIVG